MLGVEFAIAALLALAVGGLSGRLLSATAWVGAALLVLLVAVLAVVTAGLGWVTGPLVVAALVLSCNCGLAAGLWARTRASGRPA